MIVALDMIQARTTATQETREETLAGTEKESIALMPLAIPMLADPGAISTTLIMLNRAASTQQKAAFYVSLAMVIAAAFAILRLSVHGARRLSPIAQKMMGRLMGLLLCAMAVQFAINALRQMGVPLTI
jgi:multiple antibiotic resistance protein